jgi:Xaa-Pro dipeptidase
MHVFGMCSQESFFFYLFGINEPGCMCALDLTAGESLLFVPRLSQEYEGSCV